MSGYKSFAVAGAGNIGLPIVQVLSSLSDVSVIVLSRQGSAAKALPAGVKSAAINYNDKASLVSVFRAHSIDVVISSLNQDAVELQKALADAAKEAGVKHFVPSDFGVVADEHRNGLLGIKHGVADHLKSINLPYSRYSTSVFAEYAVWLGAADDTGVFHIIGAGDQPLSFSSIADIAGFVAYSLTSLTPNEIENKTFRLESDRATVAEVAELLKERYPAQHVDAIPDSVDLHWLRTMLQKLALTGALNNAADRDDGSVFAPSVWKEHKWQSLRKVLGL